MTQPVQAIGFAGFGYSDEIKGQNNPAVQVNFGLGLMEKLSVSEGEFEGMIVRHGLLFNLDLNLGRNSVFTAAPTYTLTDYGTNLTLGVQPKVGVQFGDQTTLAFGGRVFLFSDIIVVPFIDLTCTPRTDELRVTGGIQQFFDVFALGEAIATSLAKLD
ncbi:MAG: hypothetical protein A3I05_03020 [Deltaproteobacteria bacterium RIFCSPLOWO2_02_FULL_44_10]|nr:MAG: hypothetical protein A3C46_09100 [Deltaproteobacteria bacterium RIFCSPHIGHO2_02_FULL_44_16]OGQ46853.1 MAG: hypothetical protein A3I05_03020 [Deltaproteobacteria bacterium RIFCSPLOWO2_02_FULL_44_10]